MNGARGPMIDEPLVTDQTISVQWQESRVNLSELANLRYNLGWSRKQLAEHYGKTENAIQFYFQKIKTTHPKKKKVITNPAIEL